MNSLVSNILYRSGNFSEIPGFFYLYYKWTIVQIYMFINNRLRFRRGDTSHPANILANYNAHVRINILKFSMEQMKGAGGTAPPPQE